MNTAKQINTYNLTLDNQQLAREIHKQSVGNASVLKSNEGGFHTHEDLHLCDGEIEQLTLHISRALNHRYTFEDMWAIINKTGNSNIIHNHGDIDDPDLSLAYYVSANVKSGDIVFYTDKDSGVEIIRFKPKPGLLITFPSWLEHGVEPNNSKHKRIVISANMRPI